MTPPGIAGRRTKTKLKCPQCGHKEMARVSRRGFWQERVLSLAGWYPWQCAMCGEERMLRRRGTKVRLPRSEELETGETAGEHAHQH